MSNTNGQRIYFSQESTLYVSVEMPIRVGWNETYNEVFARYPRFRKWWRFWEDKYEDIPLKIVGIESVPKK